jgi:hypothetical protein
MANKLAKYIADAEIKLIQKAGKKLFNILPKKEVLERIEKAAPEFFDPARKGGATFDPRTQQFLTVGKDQGFAVSPIENPVNNSNVVPMSTLDQQIQDLLDVVRTPEVMRELQTGANLGSWLDSKKNGLVVDPSVLRPTLEDAMGIARNAKQDAIFDVGTGTEIATTPERVLGRGVVFGGTPQEKMNFIEYLKSRATGPKKAMANVGGNKEKPLSFEAELVKKGTGNKFVDVAVNKALSAKEQLQQLEGTTSPSKLSNDITNQVKKAVTQKPVLVKTINEKGNIDYVQAVDADGNKVTTDQIIFNNANYPVEHKKLGQEFIPDYDYTSTDSSIVNLPNQNNVKEILKNNIRVLLQHAAPNDFYHQGGKALKNATKGSMSQEEAAATFAPFSAGSSVPANARFWKAALEDPTSFPNKYGGGLALGGAWKNFLKVVLNDDKLNPLNFNDKGKLIKVGSFADNLADPKNSLLVTNDRHAVQAAIGLRTPDNTIPDMSNEKVYKLFSDAYTEVAKEFGLLPHEAQAAAWFAWRSLMLKNPGVADPTNFIKPTNISDIFKLPQAKRIDAINKGLVASTNISDKARNAFLQGLFNQE